MDSSKLEIVTRLRELRSVDSTHALMLAWPLLEEIRERGGVVVVKLDGERGLDDSGQYTVIVSSRELFGDDYFRTDAPTLAEALGAVLHRCANRLW